MPKQVTKTSEIEKLDLDQVSESVSDLELEEMLFENTSAKPRRANPIPTIAGFGLLGTVALYLLQQIGIFPWNISDIFIVFPLIGLFLILLFGLSPKKRRRKHRRRKNASKKDQKKQIKYARKMPPSSTGSKWNFPPKSRKKYLAGVCGGMAQRINMDPTMFRILFIIAMIATSGTVPLIAYIFFAIFMPSPNDDDIPHNEFPV